MKLIYKTGDVTNPDEVGNIFILHCVNDCVGGCMGSGVALALLKKWPLVKSEYHIWANHRLAESVNSWQSNEEFRLGEIQVVPVKGKTKDNNLIAVVNMVGQRDVVDFHGIPPIRYEAIRECLWHVRDCIEHWNKNPINIVAPKFGSALAGGDWDKIEKIIIEVFDEVDINFTVYSL